MSLIVDHNKINNSANVIKQLIPPGSVVDSYAFYDSKMEFSLAFDRRFVNAYTTSKPIFIFWKCLMYDPKRIYDIVASEIFKFDNSEPTHIALQEVWHKQENPFLLAALFFTLNRSSDTGYVSSGAVDLEKLTPVIIQKIKTFVAPENFHINYMESDIHDKIKCDTESDYILLPAGDFEYGLFDHGKSLAIEQTYIKHRELIKICNDKHNKIVIVYNFSPKVLAAYKGNRIIMVDKYGKETSQQERAKEVVVANF